MSGYLNRALTTIEEAGGFEGVLGGYPGRSQLHGRYRSTVTVHGSVAGPLPRLKLLVSEETKHWQLTDCHLNGP